MSSTSSHLLTTPAFIISHIVAVVVIFVIFVIGVLVLVSPVFVFVFTHHQGSSSSSSVRAWSSSWSSPSSCPHHPCPYQSSSLLFSVLVVLIFVVFIVLVIFLVVFVFVILIHAKSKWIPHIQFRWEGGLDSQCTLLLYWYIENVTWKMNRKKLVSNWKVGKNINQTLNCLLWGTPQETGVDSLWCQDSWVTWHFCSHSGYISIRSGGHGGIEITVRRDEVLWKEKRERGMRWLSVWNCQLKKVLPYMEYQGTELYQPFTAVMSQPIQHKTVPYPYWQLSGWRAHGTRSWHMAAITCMYRYGVQP